MYIDILYISETSGGFYLNTEKRAETEEPLEMETFCKLRQKMRRDRVLTRRSLIYRLVLYMYIYIYVYLCVYICTVDTCQLFNNCDLFAGSETRQLGSAIEREVSDNAFLLGSCTN